MSTPTEARWAHCSDLWHISPRWAATIDSVWRGACREITRACGKTYVVFCDNKVMNCHKRWLTRQANRFRIWPDKPFLWRLKGKRNKGVTLSINLKPNEPIDQDPSACRLQDSLPPFLPSLLQCLNDSLDNAQLFVCAWCFKHLCLGMFFWIISSPAMFRGITPPENHRKPTGKSSCLCAWSSEKLLSSQHWKWDRPLLGSSRALKPWSLDISSFYLRGKHECRFLAWFALVW